MVKSNIREIHDTIKTMLGYALKLSESEVVTVYQLAHYLADNILAKVCLAVAIEKGEEKQTYKMAKSGKRIIRKKNINSESRPSKQKRGNIFLV